MAINTGSFPKATQGGKGKAVPKGKASAPKQPLFALFAKKGRSGGRKK